MTLWEIKVHGGFIMRVEADTEDFAKGLAVGKVSTQLPNFKINGVTAEELEVNIGLKEE